jgi:transposase
MRWEQQQGFCPKCGLRVSIEDVIEKLHKCEGDSNE